VAQIIMRVFSFLLVFIFSSFAHAEETIISIIGTADLHGRLATLPLLGGYLDVLRAARPGRVVLVDAGDAFQGTLESDMNEGEAVIRAYALLGYNALAIGNHEFDYGPVGAKSASDVGDDPRGALKARAVQAQNVFPFLAANLQENGKPLSWRNVHPSTLVKLQNGLRVGIIGATTIKTPETTLAANFGGMSVAPLFETIVSEANKLRHEGAQIVIVAAHAGGRCQNFDNAGDLSSCDQSEEIFQLAQKLPAHMVDAIVAGHVHAGIAHEVNGIPIIESYFQGIAFGRIDLSYNTKSKQITHKTIFPPHRLQTHDTYEVKPVLPKKNIEETIAPALAAAETKRENLVGADLETPFEKSYSDESPLGNLVTSLMLKLQPKAAVAITNGGGLRADLPAGLLHYGALYNALPFENRFAFIHMKGAMLKKIFSKNLTSKGGILSIAGAHVESQCSGGQLIVQMKLDSGRAIADDEDVAVITSDFLATGGDGFSRSESTEPASKMPVIREAIADYFRKNHLHLQIKDWFNKEQPRVSIKMPRPVTCS